MYFRTEMGDSEHRQGPTGSRNLKAAHASVVRKRCGVEVVGVLPQGTLRDTEVPYPVLCCGSGAFCCAGFQSPFVGENLPSIFLGCSRDLQN